MPERNIGSGTHQDYFTNIKLHKKYTNIHNRMHIHVCALMYSCWPLEQNVIMPHWTE